MMLYTTDGQLIGELVPEMDRPPGELGPLAEALLALGPATHEEHCACHGELKLLRAQLPAPVVKHCRQCGERFEIRRFHFPGIRQQRINRVYCSTYCRQRHSNEAKALRREAGA